MLQIQQIYESINQLAPWELAESWDNVGLQVGRLDQTIRKLMLAVDLNDRVLEEGLNQNVDGFIVHHPLIFKPLSSLNPQSPQGNLIYKLIQNNLFLLAAHTNIDNAAKGINQYLADMIGLESQAVLEPSHIESCKVVVFVPKDYEDKLRKAMADAGAGKIGEYTECAFQSTGNGFFRPGILGNPFYGESGQLAKVDEIRLEMIIPKHIIPRVLKAIASNHPYEEPAIDIYPLLNAGPHGLGRIGYLPEPVVFEKFCQIVKEKLAAKELRVMGNPERKVRKIAICSGSGKSFLTKAIVKGADVYITADLSYHDYCNAEAGGLALIDAGHWTTEKGFINLIFEHLTSFFKGELEILTSNTIEGEPYVTIGLDNKG